MGARSLTRRGRPPGAQGHTPFFYQNSGVCHTQKGSLRGGDRDRAKGSRNVKSQTGFPGEHMLSQAQSPARMSTERTEKAYRSNLNNGTPLLVVYAEL